MHSLKSIYRSALKSNRRTSWWLTALMGAIALSLAAPALSAAAEPAPVTTAPQAASNPNDYECAGQLAAGKAEGEGAEGTPVQYKFKCNGQITGYQVQTQVPITGIEGQPQVEAVVAQGLHGATLEDGDPVVVAPVPHDEQVVADREAVQPGHRLTHHPERSSGQQHHLKIAIQEFQQPRHLLDQGILAAGLKEGVPVANARLQEPLTSRRVRQHPVDVEHDRGTGRTRLVPPRPVGRDPVRTVHRLRGGTAAWPCERSRRGGPG